MMTKFEQLTERALEYYGIFTAADARDLNIVPKYLREWVASGRLEKVGRGVMRLTKFPYNVKCFYAEAVALVGPGAWLFGDSVLAMLGLVAVKAPETFVATARRRRRELPNYIQVVLRDDESGKDNYEGIPCQNLVDVLLDARARFENAALVNAIQEARKQRLFSADENERLKEAFGV